MSECRRHLDMLIFLRKVLKLCTNEPIVCEDTRVIAAEVLNKPRIQSTIKRFGVRNSVEPWREILNQ